MAVASRLQNSRAIQAVLVLLLIGAFGLRLWNLNQPSIWHDEAWSIRAIRDPIHTPDDNTPPVYYGLLHFLWLGAGETPLALRYGSVLLGLLTVALGAQIARRWAGGDAAILTAVFLGASPLLWAYSREVRAYVAVPLLALVLLWQTDALLAPRARFSWRTWSGLLVAEVILLYTHNLSVPVVAWLNLAVGSAWTYQRQWKRLGVWVIGQIAVLIAYLPWLFGQSPSGTPLNTPPSIRLSLAWDIWQAYFAPVPAQLGAENALVLGSAVFGIAALLSAAAILYWNPKQRTLLVFSQAALLPVLATAELILAHIDFHPRYYSAGVPAALLLVALAVEHLPASAELHRAAIPVLMALAWGVAAASLTGLLDKPQYQHDDFRAMAAYYAQLLEDAIILVPYGWEPAFEEYYVEKAGIHAEILGIKLHGDAETFIEKINAALAKRQGPVQVELLTWYQLPADMRGMVPCLLEAAGRRAGNPFTVQGISTQGYTVERPLALAEIPAAAEIDYGIMRLAHVATGGQQAICARTAWQLQRPSGQDWRVAGRLLTTDPPGWVIAQSDTDIRRDDQAPTSDWSTGQQGDAFSLLRFPAGTPPGDYMLQVTVYSHAEPRGLDRLINGVPSGKAVALAAVQPTGTTALLDRAVLPQQGSIPLAESVQLIGHDAQGGTLNPGQELRITLQWQVMDGCCADHPWTQGTVMLRGEGWELAQPVRAYTTYSLDWHAFVIPAAASGRAALTIESDSAEPVTLATYTIEKTDRLFAPPPLDVPVQAVFNDLAVLEGFSVGQTVLSSDQAFDLTLVWRATETPGASYRVFTHLLDVNGQVIAQHDGFPVDNTRPTTGWVPGEYLVDSHSLVFLPERQDYRGPARLEVGFYDPEDPTRRVLVSNGADHIVLPLEITVQ